MKNTTEGLYPYQLALYDKIATGGFKHGEMMILSAGRQTGKSYLNQYYGKLWNNNLCKEILLPMKPEPKYKFSRANWYVTSRFASHENFLERVKWCEEQFGPEPKNHDAWSRWYTWFGVIKFRDAKDYEWFVLRWS